MNAQFAPRDSAVSLGDWIITLIVLWIPLVGLIMMFVWAFSGGTNLSKQNFCRAWLILALISFVLTIVVVVLFWGTLAALLAGGSMNSAMSHY